MTSQQSDDDLLAEQLRSAATRVSVRPGATTWQGISDRVPRARTRRTLLRVVPAGAAVAAIAVGVVVTGLLGGSNGQAAVVPAGVPIPTSVPGEPGQPPIEIRLVDEPRALDLSDADEAAVLRGCPIPADGILPGGEAQVLTTLQDAQGVTALVASRTWVQTCEVPVGPDGVADFESVQPASGIAARPWGVDPDSDILGRDEGDSAAAPVVTFGWGGYGTRDGRPAGTAIGRVSDDVALLLAVAPSGEAVVVPVDDNGAFMVHVPLEGNAPDSDVPGLPALPLYAYDAAGNLVYQVPSVPRWTPPRPELVELEPAEETEIARDCAVSAAEPKLFGPVVPVDPDDAKFLAATRIGTRVTVAAVADGFALICGGEVDGWGKPVAEMHGYLRSAADPSTDYLARPDAGGLVAYDSDVTCDEAAVYIEPRTCHATVVGRAGSGVHRLEMSGSGIRVAEVLPDDEGGFVAWVQFEWPGQDPTGPTLTAFDGAGNVLGSVAP